MTERMHGALGNMPYAQVFNFLIKLVGVARLQSQHLGGSHFETVMDVPVYLTTSVEAKGKTPLSTFIFF